MGIVNKEFYIVLMSAFSEQKRERVSAQHLIYGTNEQARTEANLLLGSWENSNLKDVRLDLRRVTGTEIIMKIRK